MHNVTIPGGHDTSKHAETKVAAKKTTNNKSFNIINSK